MNSVPLEFHTHADEAVIPFNLCDTLLIPPELPFLQTTENKIHEVYYELDDRKSKLKAGKGEGENEPSLMPHDFDSGLNKFSDIFDVNQIPGLLTQPCQLGKMDLNPLDNLKIPRKRKSRHSGSLRLPVDVRALLHPRNSRTNADTQELVDIRNIPSNPSNEYDDYIMRSESVFDILGIRSGGTRKEKSLAGLPAKQQQLGVSKRVSKLERLIRMVEGTMTKKQLLEKTHLMRLEKNRRAAAISREKKKQYIRSLEERSLIMSRHLEALELENRQLRKSLSKYNIHKLKPNSNVLTSFRNLEPSTFNEASGPASSENGKHTLTYMDELITSESKNLTGGYRGKLVFKLDDGLNSYHRGTKRKIVESKIPRKRYIWREKVY